jgi:hypothetical protein
MTYRFLLLVTIAIVTGWGCANSVGDLEFRLRDEIVFEAVDGQVVMRIAPKRGAVLVEDGLGAELLRLVLEADRIVILNPRRGRVGAVLPPSSDGAGYRVLVGSEVVFELKREPDGDFKMTDADQAVVYRVKLRDYGFKVVDREGEVRSRVRVRPTKTSLRDGSGRTYMMTRDALSAASAAVLSLEDLRFAYAVALSVAVSQWEPAADS